MTPDKREAVSNGAIHRASLDQPREQLRKPLSEQHPVAGNLSRGMGIGIVEPTVVKAIVVERNGVVGIDFCGNELGLLLPGEAVPTIPSVPAFTDGFAIIKLRVEDDRKNKFSFAMDDNTVE